MQLHYHRDVTALEMMMKQHQELKGKIDGRSKTIQQCADLGKILIAAGDSASEEVSNILPWINPCCILHLLQMHIFRHICWAVYRIRSLDYWLIYPNRLKRRWKVSKANKEIFLKSGENMRRNCRKVCIIRWSLFSRISKINLVKLLSSNNFLPKCSLM